MRRRMLVPLALLPALALGPVACRADGGGDPVGNARKAAAGDQDKMRKYAQCMRENGVDMDDPDPNGGIRVRVRGKPGTAKGEETMKAAEEKCRHLRPDGGKPKKPSPEELAKMRAMAKCMREHGINMPDPDPDGRVRVIHKKGEPGPEPTSPEWRQAQKECQKYAPGPKGGGDGVGMVGGKAPK
ncbi:MAG: hypothetical protein IRY90_04405 [Actinomadura rubrobrunea]|nr:hypothetical protein [Actinomadura rubrobrunea]